MSFSSSEYARGNPQIIRTEYDGNSLLIYVGQALTGSLTSEPKWAIQKLSYDGNGNLVSVLWANGDYSYCYIWDNRTTYPYS